ncbi:hypothetical protein [Burkholderia sp. Ac-20349]|uniref:hypothetical protein n=1 Tax=Burkholderia sp. Ac-20349 TaxID=2703893 RepID=UPI00197B86C3|nr:hypothetical protein [Burkholderia sp. Ac-20349]MBN3839323.1 hypothetical protein [Burkholderia sp. Ac-20349]
MAKLTPTQKAANKAAFRVRDRAYRARRDAYHRARGSAEEALDKADCATARDDAANAFNLAIEARDSALREVDRQIAELKAKRDDVGKSHDGPIEELREKRNAACDAYRDARRTTLDAVELEFSDVSNLWSVMEWTIPADVQAEMDKAAAAVLHAPRSAAPPR